jgi:hypothetical protein
LPPEIELKHIAEIYEFIGRSIKGEKNMSDGSRCFRTEALEITEALDGCAICLDCIEGQALFCGHGNTHACGAGESGFRPGAWGRLERG